MYSNDKIEKICTLYVSKWHLATILLPNVNQRIQNGEKVITFFEEDFSGYINELMNRLNLNENNRNKIMGIDWCSKKIGNDIKEYISFETNADINIIISGSEQYLYEVNSALMPYLKNNKNEVHIIDCFDVSDGKDIDNLLSTHQKLLNTSGVKDLQTVLNIKEEKLNVANI